MMEWLQTAKDKKKVEQTLDGHLADYTTTSDGAFSRCPIKWRCHIKQLRRAFHMHYAWGGAGATEGTTMKITLSFFSMF
jgi:hypothetical protein